MNKERGIQEKLRDTLNLVIIKINNKEGLGFGYRVVKDHSEIEIGLDKYIIYDALLHSKSNSVYIPFIYKGFRISLI